MMNEIDQILMTLVIFVPALFALGLMFFPAGGADEASQQRAKNAMRWWCLFGTALTLGLSICAFFLFHREVIDTYLGPSDKTLLNTRVEAMEADPDARAAPEASRRKSSDWVSKYPWISRFNIDYFLGVDGISMPLIILTTLLCFLAMIASWNIDRYVRGYCMLFLVLETGMIGTFLALDFFLFYVFWEVMLLPMYFLIGVWGGPRREYAAIKFFLYTLLGSVFILIALLGFYFTDVRDFVSDDQINARAEQLKASNPRLTMAEAESRVTVNTFNLILLQRVGSFASKYLKADGDFGKIAETDTPPGLRRARSRLEAAKKGGQAEEIKSAEAALTAAEERITKANFFQPWFQITMFLLLFIGFAIKVPMFPFHTWLPDAHVEAPTPISMILAGVLLKMGGYGILRIAYPICPWAAETLAWYVALFGVISIVYGALAAMAQTDFKKLVAYSSVSHMGYVVLGIAVWSAPERSQYWAWGMNGAMFQMIAHGISSAGMFFLVGVIYDRAHHRNLDNFRGLNEPMPLYSGISAIIFFAAMGLPGLCGFWGEAWVVLATWNYDKVFAILAALTVVLTAGYILWTVQRVFLGTNPAYKDYPDIDLRELAAITPLVVLAVLLGIMPSLLLSWMDPSVTGLVNQLARLGK